MERRETKQREKVLEAARELYHPTAEEVFCNLKNKGVAVSRATVFRNLAVLCEENKLLKIFFQDQPARFDTSILPHNHFVCLKCGRIIDLHQNNTEEVSSDCKGLQIVSKSVTYYGFCENCKQK